MRVSTSYNFFILLVTVLLFSIDINAQSAQADTTYEVTTVPAESYDTATDEQTYYPDTLKSEYRTVVYDSMLVINNDKGFYYKRYMDSLLRATGKKDIKPPRRITFDGFFSSLFTLILWIGAIVLFSFLIFKLFLSNSPLFSRNRKNISVDIDTATDTETNDPDANLRNAIRNGNYRLAVRYLYLQTLMQLYERKFIDISSNKTNYEYVNEVRKQKFANEFASLTLQYEYVWYGEYSLDERLFGQIQEGFTQFNKNISK